jgi:hypothetical protein
MTKHDATKAPPPRTGGQEQSQGMSSTTHTNANSPQLTLLCGARVRIHIQSSSTSLPSGITKST